MLRWIALFLFCALPLRAEEQVVLGLSQDEVAITATFDGSNILIFGAVKREEPIPTDSQLHVIITVAGPSESVIVRRKDRVAGIWANVEALEVDLAPSFYAVLTSAPLADSLTGTEDLRQAISPPRAIRSVGAPMGIVDASAFTDALIRVRTEEGLYQVVEGAVDLEQDTLFRGQVTLPANLTEGDYKTRIFLTRNGAVINTYETVISINKVGLERWLYELSRKQPFFYGLLSLAIAIIAGWGASAAFQAIRR